MCACNSQRLCAYNLQNILIEDNKMYKIQIKNGLRIPQTYTNAQNKISRFCKLFKMADILEFDFSIYIPDS